MNRVNAGVFIVGLLPFAAFSWGVKGHFRSTGAMPAGMRLLSGASILEFAWFSWRLARQPGSPLWPFASLMFLISIVIFTWAVRTTRQRPPTLAFADDKPFFLYQKGPYRFVRHPFYLAYLAYWAGTAAAAPAHLGWAAPIPMLLLYANAARGEERKFANSDLAAAYEQYRRRVGMFLPRPSALLSG